MNDLVTLIINSDNEFFDGKYLTSSYFNSHIKSLLKINEYLINKFDFDLGYFSVDDINSAAYDIISNGHILFLNISFNDNKNGILYLPDTYSEKQEKSLNELQSNFSDYNITTLRIEGEKLVYTKIKGINDTSTCQVLTK